MRWSVIINNRSINLWLWLLIDDLLLRNISRGHLRASLSRHISRRHSTLRLIVSLRCSWLTWLLVTTRLSIWWNILLSLAWSISWLHWLLNRSPWWRHGHLLSLRNILRSRWLMNATWYAWVKSLRRLLRHFIGN